MKRVPCSSGIKFWPKDNNIGLSRNMLLQIKELSRAYNQELFLGDEPDCTYYTETMKGAEYSSYSEIKEIIDGVREICKGIELEFKFYKVVLELLHPSDFNFPPDIIGQIFSQGTETIESWSKEIEEIDVLINSITN